jgi:hypothetical protein
MLYFSMMPIDQDFPKKHQVIGKNKHADDEHFP